MSRCLDCGFVGGSHFHLCPRVAPVYRTAPTEPPPPYSAMPAKAEPYEFSDAESWMHRADDAIRLANSETQRANRLGDEAGALRSQLRDVEAENSRLRRNVERLTRKAGGR